MTNSNKSHAAQDAMTDNQSSGSATSRKRSSGINLSRMRKSYALKPLAIGIASVFLSACGEEKQDAQIYTSLEDCKRDFPCVLALALIANTIVSTNLVPTNAAR